jgi:hypothetical protein
MNRFLLSTLLLATALPSMAEEVARVVSSTPVTQQVGVPRQACATSATPGVPPKCSVQTVYENRTVYNVVYEYAGKQYSVQLPQDPGATLRLQITAVDAPAQPAPMAAGSVAPAPSQADNTVVVQETVVAPGYPGFVAYGYPGYVSYYGSPYYGFWGPTLSLGFVGGFYGGGRGHFGGHGHGHRR